MKQLLKKAFTFVAVLALGVTSAFAVDEFSYSWGGTTWYFTLAENGYATITRADGIGADFRVTASVWKDGVEYPVTAIGGRAFKGVDAIKDLTLPAGLQYIETNAFESCTSLTNVTYLGADNVAVDGSVFGKCTAYLETKPFGFLYNAEGAVIGFTGVCPETLEIPDGVAEIGVSAFDYDYYPSVSNVTALIVPASVKEIGQYAFYELENLKSVTLNEGLETIGNAAFDNCYKLPSVVMPSTVKTIGWDAFEDCESLESVTLNEGLEYIGEYAFAWSGVKEITVPASVTELPDDVFFGCTKLASVTLKEGLEAIGDYAFWGCTPALTSIEIPGSVETIGRYAFAGCKRLETLTIKDGVSCIMSCAFTDCVKLSEVAIPGSVKAIGDYAFNQCHKLQKVTLAEGLEEIGYRAFTYTKVDEITLPTTVYEYDNWAFENVGAVTVNVSYIGRKVIEAGVYDIGGTIPTTVTVKYYGDDTESFMGKFHRNDGSDTLDSVTLYDGCMIGWDFPYVEREGYVLRGWNTKADASGDWVKVNSLASKSAPDYYAIWAKKDTSIALELNGEWTVESDGSYYNGYGDYMYARIPGAGTLSFEWRTDAIPHAWSGHPYAEFYCNSVYEEIWSSTEWATVTVDVTAADYNVTQTNTFRWYAFAGYVKNIKWTPAPYTVTFDINGGTGYQAPLKFDYPYAAVSFANLTNAFVRENHKFAGWELREYEDDGSYIVKKFIPAENVYGIDDDEKPFVVQSFAVDFKSLFDDVYDIADVKLYAEWTPDVHTVTIKSTAVDAYGTFTLPYGADIIEPDCWKPGLKITGWIPEFGTVMGGDDVTYTVRSFEPNNFAITFDLGDGVSGSLAPATFSYNTETESYDGAVVITNTVGREGYTLVGWEYDCKGGTWADAEHTIYDAYNYTEFLSCTCTETESGAVIYVFDLSNVLANNNWKATTLRAVWVENLHTTLVDPEGGNKDLPIDLRPAYFQYGYGIYDNTWDYEWRYLSMTNDVKFTRKGYTLAGWDYAHLAWGVLVHEETVPVDYDDVYKGLNYSGDGHFPLFSGFFGTDAEGAPINGTLYANWSNKLYTVTFYKDIFDADTNGTPLASWTLSYDDVITAPDSTFPGLKIVGWKSVAGAPALVSGETKMPDKDVAYYAVFDTTSFKVSFDANASDATGAMADMTFKYDETADAFNEGGWVTNKFVREGYTLAGWTYACSYTDANGKTFVTNDFLACTTEVKGGKPVTYCWIDSNLNVFGLEYAAYNDMTLKAEWVPNLVHTLDAGDESGETAELEFYWSGTGECYLPRTVASPFTKTGYKVCGWSYEDENGVQQSINTNANGKCTFDAYSFGYNTNETITVYTNEYDAVVEGTFYAVWAANKHKLTFTQEGKFTPAYEYTLAYGDPIITPSVADVEAVTGKANQMLTGISPAIKAGETMPDKDVNYTFTGYADNSFTFKFDLNSGEGSMADVKFWFDGDVYGTAAGAGDSVEVSNAVKRAGYTFAGWSFLRFDDATEAFVKEFLPNTPSNKFTLNRMLNGNRDTTLTAEWIKDVTVTLDANDGSGKTATLSLSYDSTGALVITNTTALVADGKSVIFWTYRKAGAAEDAEDSALWPDYASTGYSEALTFTLDVAKLVEMFGKTTVTLATGYDYDVPNDGTLYANWNDNIVATFVDDTFGTADVPVELGWANTNLAFWIQTKNVKVPFAVEGYDVTSFEYESWEWVDAIGDYDYVTYTNDVDVATTNVTLGAGMFGYDDMNNFEPLSGKLYANWDVHVNTVTFKLVRTDASVESLQYALNYGETIVAPDSWVPGYKITGWRSDYDPLPAKMPNRDVVYTAEWELDSFKVSFDGNGGSDVAGDVQFSYIVASNDYTAAVSVTNAATREGYSLAGWTAVYEHVDANDYVADGKVKVQTITNYLPVVTIENKDGSYSTVTTVGADALDVKKDVTFKADWVQNFKFTLDPDDPSLSPVDVELVWAVEYDAVGNKIDEGYVPENVKTSDIFDKVGYVTTSWDYTYTPEGATEAVTVNHDFDFSKKPVSITIVDQEFIGGELVITEAITNYAYAFTFDASTNAFPEVYSTNGTFLTLNPTLKAVWTAATPTATFLWQDGTEMASWAQPYETQIVPPDSLSNGWMVAEWTPEIPEKMPLTNVTFKAKSWATNSFEITFSRNADDAIGEMEPVKYTWKGTGYDYGATPVVTNMFVREGYTMVGWDYTFQTFGVATNADGSVAWEGGKIKFDSNVGLVTSNGFIKCDFDANGEVSPVYVDQIVPELNLYKPVELRARWVKDAVVTLAAKGAESTTVAIPYPFNPVTITNTNNVPAVDGKSVIYWTYTNKELEDKWAAGGAGLEEFYTLMPDTMAAGNTACLEYTLDPVYLFGVDATAEEYRPYDGTLNAVLSDNIEFTLVGDPDELQIAKISLGWYNDKGISWYQKIVVPSPFVREGEYVVAWTNVVGKFAIPGNYDSATGESTLEPWANLFGYEKDGKTPKTGTLAAVWMKKNCTVSFVQIQGVVTNVYATWTLNYGDPIYVPDPVRGELAYRGWMLGNFTPEVAATAPDKDVTYAFEWITNGQFTVSFDANGGEGEMDDITFTYNAKTDEYLTVDPETGDKVSWLRKINSFTREGYALVGWDWNYVYTDRDGVTTNVPMYYSLGQYQCDDEGNLYTETWIDSEMNNLDWDPATTLYKDITLKARWAKTVDFTLVDAEDEAVSRVVPVPYTDPEPDVRAWDDVYYPEVILRKDGYTLQYLTYRPEYLPDDAEDIVLLPEIDDPQHLWYKFNPWMFCGTNYTYKITPLSGTLKAYWSKNVEFTVDPNYDGGSTTNISLGWSKYGTNAWYQADWFEIPFAREGMHISKLEYTPVRASAITNAQVWTIRDADDVKHSYAYLEADMFGFNPKTLEPQSGVLTAIWANDINKMTYDFNGGKDYLARSSIVSNQEFGTELWLPEVIREGYKFVGWINAETFEAVDPEAAVVPGDPATFFARWDREDGKRYHVAFEANSEEATGEMETLECFVGEPTPIDANGFARTGLHIDGWATSATGAKVYEANGPVTFTDADDPDKTLTLYALWATNIVTVTFDFDGVPDGDGATSKAVVAPYGTAIDAPDIAQFAPEGFSFYGWDPEFDGIVPAEDATYVAVWTPPVFNIAFDKNAEDAVGEMEPEEFEYGKEKALTANAFTREGYTFMGWATKANGEVVYSDEEVVAMKAPATLYAVWELNVYTVVFDFGKGVDAEGRTSVEFNIPHGSILDVVAIPQPTLEGYTFLGWKPEVVSPVTASATYNAIWKIDNASGLYLDAIDQEFGVLEDVKSMPLDEVFPVVVNNADPVAPTVKISGLPSGVKFDKNSNTFTGAAKKAGIYYVTCTAKNANKYSYVAISRWNIGEVQEETETFDQIGDLDEVFAELDDLAVGFPVVIELPADKVKSVSGLPAGLKFTAKDIVDSKTKEVVVYAGSIYGTPTKAAKYVVKFTGAISGKKAQKALRVIDSGMYAVDCIITEESKGVKKVTGTGAYAVGKKVTLKATADNDYVFSGWYLNGELVWMDASYTFVLDDVENLEFTPTFVTKAADSNPENMSLAVAGADLSTTEALKWTVKAGVAVEWEVANEALTATKVTASGLPAGLKLVQDKATMAYSITGAPTTASKPGKPSNVKLTVTTAGKFKQTYLLEITVEALPDWVVGTFNGAVYRDSDSVGMLNNLTVSKAGKISGKATFDGLTWTISAASFEDYDDGVYLGTVILKSGKTEIKSEIALGYTTYGEDSKVGIVEGFIEKMGIVFAGSQNLWKLEPWKSMAKSFSGATINPEPEIVGRTVTLKFNASGAVTAAGEFLYSGTTYKATCSTTFCYDGEKFTVPVYFAPKSGKFDGFSAVYEIELDENGKIVTP